jgi:hypothetical protein
MLRWGIEIFKDYYFNENDNNFCVSNNEGMIDEYQSISYVFLRPESVDFCFGKQNELFIATVVR